MELWPQEHWQVESDGVFDDEGDLVDRDKDESILVRATDTLLSKNMDETAYEDPYLTQWVISYPVKKVLKFQPSHIDLNKPLDEGDEEDD